MYIYNPSSRPHHNIENASMYLYRLYVFVDDYQSTQIIITIIIIEHNIVIFDTAKSYVDDIIPNILHNIVRVI